MNRYVVQGVLTDLAIGRRVLVITENLRESRVMLDQLTSEAVAAGFAATDLVVRRANGAERVELPRTGGSVHFLSHRQSSRGMSADVIFIDGDPTQEELAELMPVIAASPRGELIRR